MGTPAFAVPSLDMLVANGYKPIAVVTAPDRKKGRGRKILPSAVKMAAERHGVETILQPESVKSPEFLQEILELEADLIVVVAFRILPPAVFQAARFGSFNLHGSLLPKYRGAAPIHRAVLQGERQTGVTTFFLKEKVDTGSVILRRTLPIGPEETTGDVHDKMMVIGADAVLQTVKSILEGSAQSEPQDDLAASPAPKVFSEEARISWNLEAQAVHNHIRGMSPVPGAFSIRGEDRIKFYRSRVHPSKLDLAPGQLLSSEGQLIIGCGTGAVEIIELQPAGKRRMSATEFLAGNVVDEGEVLR